MFEREGLEGLTALPGMERALTTAILRMVRTGQLERLRGAADD